MRIRCALVLLETRSRLRQSRQLTLLREDDTTRPDSIRFQGRAKSRSTPQMQPQRYSAVYDAIRNLATSLTLFLHSPSSESSTRSREDKKRSAVEDRIGGKNQFHETELATSLFELEQENVAQGTNRPTGFVHEHYLGWQPRAASTFLLILLRFPRQRSKVSSRRNIPGYYTHDGFDIAR